MLKDSLVSIDIFVKIRYDILYWVKALKRQSSEELKNCHK